MSNEDLSDPTALAVKVVTIESSIALLSERVAGMSAVLLQVQADQRAQTGAIEAVRLGQQTMSSHSEGLERCFTAVASSRRDWMDWCKQHLAENELTGKSVSDFTASLRTLKWVSSIVAIMGGALVSVSLAFFNLKLDNLRNDHERDASNTRTMIDANTAGVRRINERFGTTPSPLTPP